MNISVEAIYENGILKLAQPLPLEEKQKVNITIQSRVSLAEKTAGMIPWTGDEKTLEILACDDEFGILATP